MNILRMIAAAMTISAAALAVSCKDTAIKDLPVNVTLDRESVKMSVGDELRLNVSVSPEGTATEWSSDNPGVASVDDGGLVSAISEGSATIEVKAGDRTAECRVTVIAAQVQSVTLDNEYIEIKVGETATLTAEILPEAAAGTVCEWESSAPAIASVDGNGNVKGLTPGTATVTVTAGGKSDQCLVTVDAIDVESVRLDVSNIDIYIGETARLNATVLPENATDKSLEWSSSDEKVVTVDNEGNIYGVAAGEAVITVKSALATDQCNVRVLYPESSEVMVGDYYYSDGSFSSNPDASKTVVGIVFWTGDPTAMDPALKADHPECTHGLVVSATGEVVRTPWQENFQAYGKTVGEWGTANTSYLTTVSGYDGSEPDYLNKIMGYNNTRLIEEFNAAPENSEWKVDAIEYLKDFRDSNAAPAATSGWYLPSAKEVSILCSGDYEGNIWDIYGESSMRDLLNSKIADIEGGQQLDGYDYYWSSTEVDAWNTYVVYFNNGAVYANYLKNSVDVVIRTRFVLAF